MFVKKRNVTVEELINELMKIGDKSKDVRLLSADQSNDTIGEISINENVVYLLGE
jgi:ribosomal protein S7